MDCLWKKGVFYDVSHVLTWISSTKDESLISGILSVSISFGNSHLSLVGALKDLSNAESVSSKIKILFMIFNPTNFSPNLFAAKNSPLRLLLRGCQCLLPSKQSKSVLPVFEFFLIINLSISSRPGSPVKVKCLYNEVILSGFTLCLICRVDVASLTSFTMMSLLPCLYLVDWNHHNLRLEAVEWFLHQQIYDHPFYF